ncbi:metallophosphoesterase family protein [Pseudorhodoferax soli]|uniref:3',5'-cyclic AMP phosphodiesterase CpdA n=1 Tax=Pseudorhodoferax soli TaxID=545864 RepID=A0A368Y4F9_9BURK|nr:metallophosphoesterase [Pseudorhodoferax soli]RCW74226.1 3',5'-cyclic AMP phosphodiesterase CpdA [Pseudorhodoferax soli]
MSVLLQVSDTHFGTERAPVVEALLALADQLAPQLVVLSGDITQRATVPQFAAAQAFCRRLRRPVLAIPGNHDIPLVNLAARLLWPYARHRQAFGPELEPVHASPDWLVVCVKTTRRWRHQHGQVSREQTARVAARLRQAEPGQLRVVVVHQPVAVPTPRDAGDLLRGHEEAVRAWAAAGADVVAGGHIHLPYVLPLHELHAGLARRMWCVQAGTAVSSRLRREANNSVNVLHRAGAAARVERWDFDEASQRFACVSSRALDLDRGSGHV